MESENSSTQTSFSISQFGFKGGKYIYSASVVCLTNVAQRALDEIEPSTAFGKKFYELLGTSVQDFLTSIKRAYEDYHVDSVSSLDHRTSDDVWFSERPIRGNIKGANTPLSKAGLVVIMTALVSQLRQRVFNLQRARIQSEFSSGLKDSIEECLSSIPEQKEKTLLVRKRKEKKEDEEEAEDEDKEEDEEEESEDTKPEMRTIKVWYEPFIDQIAGAFSEASKAQRIVNTKEREERQQQRQKERELGWKKVGNKNDTNHKRRN